MALTDDLISYYALDEASGNRADSHGTNTLTDNNTVLSATGKIGTAADFESTAAEFLSCADNASISTGDIDYTWSLWINPESVTAATIFVVLSKDGRTSLREFNLYLFGSSLTFECHNGGTTVVGTVTWGSALSAGTWYHVVFWHSATSNQVGISVNNGTPVTASTTGAPGDTTSAFRIGADVTGTSRYYDGLVDEVGFWKRVLTSQERTDLYNGGAGLAYPFTAAASTANNLLLLGVG